MADFDGMLREFLVDLNGDGRITPDEVAAQTSGIPNYGLGPVTQATRAGRPNAEMRAAAPARTWADTVQSGLDAGAIPAKGAKDIAKSLLDLAAYPGDLLTGNVALPGPIGSRENMLAMVPRATEMAMLVAGGPTPGGAVGSGAHLGRAWKAAADKPQIAIPAAAAWMGAGPSVMEVLGGEPADARTSAMMAGIGAAAAATPSASRVVGKYVLGPAADAVAASVRRIKSAPDQWVPGGFGNTVETVVPESQAMRDAAQEANRANWLAGRDRFARQYAGDLSAEAARPSLVRLPVADEIAANGVSTLDTSAFRPDQFVRTTQAPLGSRAYIRRQNDPVQIERRSNSLKHDEIKRERIYAAQDESRRQRLLDESLAQRFRDDVERNTGPIMMQNTELREQFAREPAKTLLRISDETGIPPKRLMKSLIDSGFDLSNFTRNQFQTRVGGPNYESGTALFDMVRNSPTAYRWRRQPYENSMYDRVAGTEFDALPAKGDLGLDELGLTNKSSNKLAGTGVQRGPTNNLANIGDGGATSDIPTPQPRTASPGPSRATGSIPYDGFSEDVIRGLKSINPRTARDLISDPAKADAQLRSLVRQITRAEKSADVPEAHMQAARDAYRTWVKFMQGGGA